MLNFTDSPPNEDYKHFDPERLANAEAQSQTTIHGWSSFYFGIPFALIGAAGLLVYLGIIPVDPKKIEGPTWMIFIFAGFFLFCGLSLMWHGYKGVMRKKRIDAGQIRAPSSPWHWDYTWNHLGYSKEKWRQPLKAFFLFVVFTAFLLPFNWWAFFSSETSFILYFVVGIFDLIIIGIFCQFVYQLIQYFKYGTSRLLFFGFPFHIGDTAKIALEGLPSHSQIEELEMNLRYIEERYEVTGTGKNRRSEVVCYEVYVDNRKLTGQELPYSPALEMEWPLPNDAELATQLSARPAKFWELEVKAKTPGVDYHERFLLPVYAKP